MNILFLTMASIPDLREHDIYQDLCRCFAAHGHRVFVVTPAGEHAQRTTVGESMGCTVVQMQTGKSSPSLIRKGIGVLTLPSRYAAAVEQHLGGIAFDLILYSTPPITLLPVIRKLKKKHRCRTYLMLKDIFPQNAVDLQMFSRRSPIYGWFRMQEKQLYRISDCIGCMSDANVDYLRRHNDLADKQVELCPNALEIRQPKLLTQLERRALCSQYGIPEDRIVLVYGGNLGAPQGIHFIAECLESVKHDERIFFLIVGGGSAYHSLEASIRQGGYTNVLLMDRLPREDYFRMMQLGQVGLVFLDRRFTIPNFPSRILSYMEYGMPVACVTDAATDVGVIAEDNGFGWRAESGSTASFLRMIDRICEADLGRMGDCARAYLCAHYDVEDCCRTITEKTNE